MNITLRTTLFLLTAAGILAGTALPASAQYFIKRDKKETETQSPKTPDPVVIPKTTTRPAPRIPQKAAPVEPQASVRKNDTPSDIEMQVINTCSDKELTLTHDLVGTFKTLSTFAGENRPPRTKEEKKAQDNFQKIQDTLKDEEKNKQISQMMVACLNKQRYLDGLAQKQN